MPSLPESISSLRTLDTRISRIERISADDVEGMWPSDHTRDSNQYRHFELKTTVPIRVNPPNLRDSRVRRWEKPCAPGEIAGPRLQVQLRTSVNPGNAPMRRAPLLLLVASNLAAAQTPGDNSDSASIAALEQRIEDAMVRRDAEFLESVYAPTFRFKHSTGSLETRAQRMTSVRRQLPSDAPGRFIARTVDSLDVEIHGDVALTTGRIHVRRDGGDPRWRDYTVRYARI